MKTAEPYSSVLILLENIALKMYIKNSFCPSVSFNFSET